MFWLCNGLFCLCAFLLGGKMAGLDIATRRGLLAASALGGLCALMNALLPSALWLIPFPLGLRLCYGRRRPGDYLRAGLMVLSAMLLTGGGVQLLRRLGTSPGAAFFLTFGGGCFLWLLMRLGTLSPGDVRQIELHWQGRSLVLPAMADSGNLLRDVVTGLPVIVAPLRASCRLEPDLVDGQVVPPAAAALAPGLSPPAGAHRGRQLPHAPVPAGGLLAVPERPADRNPGHGGGGRPGVSRRTGADPLRRISGSSPCGDIARSGPSHVTERSEPK